MEQNIFEDSFLNTENYTTKVLSNSGFLSFVVVMVLYIIGYTYTYDSDSLYFANLFLLFFYMLVVFRPQDDWNQISSQK